MIRSAIVVVGACNFDIYATSVMPLIEADSNPGCVFTTPGGVGRNIAENLARLGCSISMLTALGQDAFGDAIFKNAAEAGLDLSKALVLPHASSSVYVCINKPDGDIAVAISDMDISQQITPGYLAEQVSVLEASELIVADANLSQETLCYLWHCFGSKLCADCVSTPKSEKLSSILEGLFCLKANRAEAEVLTGIAVESVTDAHKAAAELHRLGVRNVIVTLGENGALISNGADALHMPLMPGETRNTSGCGDAFFAGALYAMVQHEPLAQVLRSGLAMARICAASGGAVSPMLSDELLKDTIRTYQGGAWQ